LLSDKTITILSEDMSRLRQMHLVLLIGRMQKGWLAAIVRTIAEVVLLMSDRQIYAERFLSWVPTTAGSELLSL
jgi:hypothetical protein